MYAKFGTVLPIGYIYRYGRKLIILESIASLFNSKFQYQMIQIDQMLIKLVSEYESETLSLKKKINFH